MSIQPIGFLDTSMFTARYLMKYRDKAVNGILDLRAVQGDDIDPTDCPILKEWNSARALLSRLRAAAAPFFEGVAPTLGRAWIEALPPLAGTPWEACSGDYAEQHVRTRTCLVPAPGALSHSGQVSAGLNVGLVNLINHRDLCSEVNHGEHARIHLIVDVKVPVDAEADA